MSLYIYIYIYIYRHTHTNTHICNLAVTNTIFNYQNIQGLFLFSNLSPPSTLMYHIYPFPFPYIFFIYIYIYSIFISFKTNKLGICDGKISINIINICLFFISTIYLRYLSLSLSLSFRFLYNLDILIVLMLCDKLFTSSRSSWID